MPTYIYPFSGGVNAVPGFGDRWQVGFSGTFAFRDVWRILMGTSSLGEFSVGAGPAVGIDPGLAVAGQSAINPTVAMTMNKRVYLGLVSQFNFSENDDPTEWDEQFPGAGFIKYLSAFGSQDVIGAFGQLQGRLAVFGRRSIQMWTVDADPNNFALVQTLDNIGTIAPLSVLQLGDFDLLFLDDTGIRSLRTREVTLNSYVDDVGSAIDVLVKAALLVISATTCCGIVEPETKNAWLYLNGNIYVLSRHPSAKIVAWSIYLPTDNSGATFTPIKFVVYNGRTYVRGSEGGHYVYGGSDNTTYDAFTIVTAQLPWLNDKRPDTMKIGTAINVAAQGNWKMKLSMDPQSNNFVVVVPDRGVAATPNVLVDSTYDVQNYRVPGLKGTHFSLLWTNTPAAAKLPAILSSAVFHYNDGGKA